MAFVRTIAEGFILGEATTADGNDLPSAKIIFIAIPVNYFEIAFYFKGAIAIYGNLCGCHAGRIRAAKVIQIRELQRSCGAMCSPADGCLRGQGYRFGYLAAIGQGFYQGDDDGKVLIVFLYSYFRQLEHFVAGVDVLQSEAHRFY